MARYRSIDWRKHRDLQCNAGLNPQAPLMNDGLMGLDPYEIVFVKAKEYPKIPVMQGFLDRYTNYYMGQDNVTSNGFTSSDIQEGLDKEKMALQQRVAKCAAFDMDYYLEYNPDLRGVLIGRDQGVAHFFESGFYERRPYRFHFSSC